MSGKPKDIVCLTIRHCGECTHCRKSKYYTADSFEDVTAWNCHHPKYEKLTKGQGFRDYEEFKRPPGIALLDWNDKPPAIPEWCPLRPVVEKA